MGSQNECFGDPRTLLYRSITPPLEGPMILRDFDSSAFACSHLIHIFLFTISRCNLPSTLTMFLLFFANGFVLVETLKQPKPFMQKLSYPCENPCEIPKKTMSFFGSMVKVKNPHRVENIGSWKTSSRFSLPASGMASTRRTLWHLALPLTFLSVMATVSCALAVFYGGDDPSMGSVGSRIRIKWNCERVDTVDGWKKSQGQPPGMYQNL